MKFYRPTSLKQALKVLAGDEDARCLAGGATLVAMMNASLIAPTALVSLAAVKGLAGIAKRKNGTVAIGAMTRHQAVADSDAFDPGQAVVKEAASHIGHPAIRNMGTIGGSISHADPAADYPTALVAADATVTVENAAGKREVEAGRFFTGYLETALAPGEIVVAVSIPATPAGAAGAYEKFARVQGDFATVAAAAIVAMDRGVCSFARLAIGGCAPTPVRVAAAESNLIGSRLEPSAVEAAAKSIAAACDPIDDFRGSSAYRLAILPTILARAVAAARQRAEQRPAEQHP